MNLFEPAGKFEHDCMWFVQRQGYIVRRAIPVVSDSAVEDATDIDVWGIKFLPPMARSLAIVDCKDKKKPRVYERILVTRGLSLYSGADQTFVATPKANWKMIDFGRRGGIRVLTGDEIQRYLSSLPPERRSFGQANFNLYNDFFVKRTKVIKEHSKLRESLFEVRNLYIHGLSITNINRTIEGLKRSVDAFSHSDKEHEQTLWLFVACEYLFTFSLNLMKAAEENFTLSEEDRRGLLEKRLTYGDLPPKKVKEIVALSQKYVLESVSRGTPKEGKNLQGVVLSASDFKPPEYMPTIQGLIERITKNPMGYFDGLKALEFILFECIVPKLTFNIGALPLFTEHISGEDAVKIGKNFIAAACDSARVRREIFWVNSTGDRSEEEPSVPTQLKMQM